MKLSIEKRPANNEESYFVFTHGEKKIEASVNAVKAAALIWVFCAVVMFTFVVGQSVSQTNVAITAYMLQGNVTDMNGNPVDCHAIMNEKKVIEWKCLGMNETNTAVKA
jgi:hypothetical protein